MAISYIGGVSEDSNTAALPSGSAAGDLAVVAAGRGNAAGPSKPDDWTAIGSVASGGSGGTAHGQIAGWKVLTASDITNNNVGTWTNAAQIIVGVYRGASSVNANSATGANGTSITLPARSGLAATSWQVGLGTHRSATDTLSRTATSYTTRSTSFTSTKAWLGDSNGTTTGIAQQSMTVNASSGNVGRTFEIVAAAAVYTLSCNNGSYSRLGIASNLQKSNIVLGSRGQYLLSGNNSYLLGSRLLLGSESSYSLIGYSSTLTYLGGSVTILTTSASSYSVAYQHVFFDVRSSSSGVGETWQGWGEWYVIRSNSIIHKEFKTLDFAWLGQNGDEVWVRYVDKEGNFGDWVTYTFSVSSSYSYTQYVDFVSGVDVVNDGTTSSTPVKTIAQAKANIAANLVTDGVHVVWVKEGQTHSCTTASAWAGSDATAACVHFRRWGNSTTRPLMTWTDVSAFICGKRQSVCIEGIDLDGGYVTGFGVALSFERTGAGTRNSLNCWIIDSNIDDFWTAIKGEDALINGSNRETSTNQFLHLENVIFNTQREYHVYGLNYGRQMSLRNVLLGPHQGGWVNPFRVGSWSDFYLEDVILSGNHNGSIRFPTYTGLSAATKRGSVQRLDLRGVAPSLNGVSFTQSDGDGIGYISDIRFVGSRFDLSTVRFGLNTVSGTNSVDVSRFQVWDCSLQGAIVLVAQANGGLYSGIDISHCGFLGIDWAGDNLGLGLPGPEDKYIQSGIVFHSNFGYWPQTGSDDTRSLVSATGLTRSQLASKFSFCDYNLLGKVDSQTLYFAVHQDSPWFSNLSTWQGATIHDDHSVSTVSTTLNLTSNGLAGLIDLRQTGNVSLTNSGYPSSYWIDGDQYIKSGNPDIGPYEFLGSVYPDEPDFGGLLSYILTGQTVIYTLNGKTSILLKQNRLNSDRGTYNISGISSTLSRPVNKLTASSSSYTIDGKASTLLKDNRLSSLKGSYTITGKDSNLSLGRHLIASSTIYTINGISSTLARPARALSLDSSTYIVSGKSLTLLKQGKLELASATYILQGISNSMLRPRYLESSAANYTVTGKSSLLLRQNLLNCLYSQFTVIGITSSLIKASKLTGDKNTYTISSYSAGVFKNRFLDVLSAAISVSGVNSSLIKHNILSFDISSYVLNGSIALLSQQLSNSIIGAVGTYVISSTLSSLLKTSIVNCNSTNYSTNYISSSLLKSNLISCAKSQIITNGTVSILSKAWQLPQSSSLSITINSISSTLSKSNLISCGGSLLSVNSQNSNLSKAYLLTSNIGSYIISYPSSGLVKQIGLYTTPLNISINGSPANLVEVPITSGRNRIFLFF